jgi:hypothetical protein
VNAKVLPKRFHVAHTDEMLQRYLEVFPTSVQSFIHTPWLKQGVKTDPLTLRGWLTPDHVRHQMIAADAYGLVAAVENGAGAVTAWGCADIDTDVVSEDPELLDWLKEHTPPEGGKPIIGKDRNGIPRTGKPAKVPPPAELVSEVTFLLTSPTPCYCRRSARRAGLTCGPSRRERRHCPSCAGSCTVSSSARASRR